MEYPTEFGNLITYVKDNCKGEFIGIGNPTSNFLFVGKEPAISEENKLQRLLEIEKNCAQWENNISQGFDISDISPMYDKNYQYNPLYPYKGQTYSVYTEKNKKGEGGTSKTWYQYQKLWDLICDAKTKRHSDFINFHEHCFSTELSSANEKYSSRVNSGNRSKSINLRKGLLCHPFYQRFSIVILAVGHYPRQHGINIESIFRTKWKGQTCTVGRFWYNIHDSLTSAPKLLIHTNQLSMVSDELIKEIADRCIEFKSKNHIKL